MASDSTKIHLPVTRDLNWWFKFSKAQYRVQLAGDIRKGWFWLEQYAKKLGKDTFMKDFSEILNAIERDNIVRKSDGEYPIGIFNLYISNEHK